MKIVNHHCLPEKGLVKNYFSNELHKASLCSLFDRHDAKTLKELSGGLFNTFVLEIITGGEAV